jgi:hypothetical protein
MTPSLQSARKVRVWDLPVRIFHWLLALLIACSFITAELGGNAMVWHERSGIAILVLISFRLIWGIVGSRHARFASFVRGPSAVIASVRGASSGLGHSPLAALSVLALLGAVGFQAITGLFTNDDIAFEGPLAAKVSGKVSHWLTELHEGNESILMALICLHLAAVAWYTFIKRRSIIKPMITGDASIADPRSEEASGSQTARIASDANAPSRDDVWMRLWALLIAAGCATAAWVGLLR